MPLDRHVRGLEGSWEDSVGQDELSEEWRGRQDVALIEGSDSETSDSSSIPPLIDGSDLDDDERVSGEHYEGLNAAGQIHYSDDTVVYGRLPFGAALSPLQLVRGGESYVAFLNRGQYGLRRVVHPQTASVVYRGHHGASWLVPQCLVLSAFDALECPVCASCWWGPEFVSVFSTWEPRFLASFRDNAGGTERRLRTRTTCYGWSYIGSFVADSVRHLFGRGGRLIFLYLDLNGLTFYRGSCRCCEDHMPGQA